jgi:hypothetical protein
MFRAKARPPNPDLSAKIVGVSFYNMPHALEVSALGNEIPGALGQLVSPVFVAGVGHERQATCTSAYVFLTLPTPILSVLAALIARHIAQVARKAQVRSIPWSTTRSMEQVAINRLTVTVSQCQGSASSLQSPAGLDLRRDRRAGCPQVPARPGHV